MDADYLILRQQINWLDECLRSQGNISRDVQIRLWKLEQRVHKLGATVHALREVLLKRSVIKQEDLDLHSLD